MYILCFQQKKFPILKIKNVKRVKFVKEKSKDWKKKIKKNIRNEPQQKNEIKIDHKSDANSNATTFYFTLQNNSVQLVKNDTINEGQTA